MRRALGQPVLIETLTGASGSIGVDRVARASPDGHTVSIGHWNTHVANGAVYDLPYDLLRDLEPVVPLPSNPMLIVSRTGVPARDLQELITWVKTNPDKVTAGTAGTGSGTHISGVFFQKMTGRSPPIGAVSRHWPSYD